MEWNKVNAKKNNLKKLNEMHFWLDFLIKKFERGRWVKHMELFFFRLTWFFSSLQLVLICSLITFFSFKFTSMIFIHLHFVCLTTQRSSFTREEYLIPLVFLQHVNVFVCFILNKNIIKYQFHRFHFTYFISEIGPNQHESLSHQEYTEKVKIISLEKHKWTKIVRSMITFELVGFNTKSMSFHFLTLLYFHIQLHVIISFCLIWNRPWFRK